MDKANIFTEDNDFNICKSWLCDSTEGGTWSLSEWFNKKVVECPEGVDQVKYDCETDGIFSCEEWEEAVGWKHDYKVDDPNVDREAKAMADRLNAYVARVNGRIRALAEADLEMENTCTKCDCTINTVCKTEDFWAHNVGRVKCPECGAIVLPCNECAAETPLAERDCDHCPWMEAGILESPYAKNGEVRGSEVCVPKSDVYRMVEETNGFHPTQKVVGWHYSGDDEIVFDTNKSNGDTEHYYLLEFVFQVGQNVSLKVRKMRCNQFGVRGDEFFFYRDSGATSIDEWE